MKGISPVIATILLLLITVAIIGIAFNFFSRTTSQTTQTVETQTEAQVAQFTKTISIEAGNATAVVIRATGTGTVLDSEYKVYVNNALRSCGSPWVNLTPQAVYVCHFGAPTCVSPQKVKVTSPANSIEEVCP